MQTIEEKITEMAKRIAPNYPNIESVSTFEQLWAIEASYLGTDQANGDCHKVITAMQKTLEWNTDKLLAFWKKEIER